MKEITGNLWDFHNKGYWVAITTNGSVRKDGRAVMGRGVALEAAQRFPGLQEHLGRILLRSGSHVWPFHKWRLITFPTKWKWMEPADLQLIEWSAQELATKWLAVQLEEQIQTLPCYLVRPGCSNGGLKWEAVKEVIAPILDDRFVIVERNQT